MEQLRAFLAATGERRWLKKKRGHHMSPFLPRP
jgi:hypothetical protein